MTPQVVTQVSQNFARICNWHFAVTPKWERGLQGPFLTDVCRSCLVPVPAIRKDRSERRRGAEAPPAAFLQSQLSAPPVLYSMTLVSKKFFSFLRSISSLIHGNGFVAPG